jgi:hypothetical protein
MTEGLLHQARIEHKVHSGYTKNGFAAAVKALFSEDPDRGDDVIHTLSARPVKRPDAFLIDHETSTIRAVEVVSTHNIKDDKAMWFSRLHDELIDTGWWLEVEIVDAVSGFSKIIENPYECWGLLRILSAPDYDPKKGISAEAWTFLKGMGAVP